MLRKARGPLVVCSVYVLCAGWGGAISVGIYLRYWSILSADSCGQLASSHQLSDVCGIHLIFLAIFEVN